MRVSRLTTGHARSGWRHEPRASRCSAHPWKKRRPMWARPPGHSRACRRCGIRYCWRLWSGGRPMQGPNSIRHRARSRCATTARPNQPGSWEPRKSRRPLPGWGPRPSRSCRPSPRSASGITADHRSAITTRWTSARLSPPTRAAERRSPRRWKKASTTTLP